jgi:hypothetical protein
MSVQNEWDKDPTGVLDWVYDWDAWLEAGESIASALVTVPTGINLDLQVDNARDIVAWFSGGGSGGPYRCPCKIVTDSAREDTRSVFIRMRPR